MPVLLCLSLPGTRALRPVSASPSFRRRSAVLSTHRPCVCPFMRGWTLGLRRRLAVVNSAAMSVGDRRPCESLLSTLLGPTQPCLSLPTLPLAPRTWNRPCISASPAPPLPHLSPAPLRRPLRGRRTQASGWTEGWARSAREQGLKQEGKTYTHEAIPGTIEDRRDSPALPPSSRRVRTHCRVSVST